ncbi:hypothetical protein DSO57_1003941 [Entomophthora muscae]|uniref:Uncharacterized protein n=1 Tax=Entomophthora muscae TaxID=34485 RepID=A0ACC2RZG1_9FUNG|nr:hypothetical protein DSO57_1003941 [Entomophthora muscae]
METPVTPKPMLASSPDLPTNHTGKLFVIVYITLTGVIGTIIPATGPWSWAGQSFSYLFKLAPLLWWALPTKSWPKLTLKTTGQSPKTGSLTKKEDTELPAQLLAPKIAKPAEAASKEETQEEKKYGKIRQVLVPFDPATFYTNYSNHVERKLFLSPLFCRSSRIKSMALF